MRMLLVCIQKNRLETQDTSLRLPLGHSIIKVNNAQESDRSQFAFRYGLRIYIMDCVVIDNGHFRIIGK
jgi:hypothetical protein